MSRLSIRARLTAAFAGALLLVLTLAGLFVYARVSSELTAALDGGLRSRADDLAALVASARRGEPRLSGSRRVESEEGFSQILRPDGAIVASTLPSAGAAIDPEQARRAAAEPVLVDGVAVAGVEGQARLLAAPASSPAGRYVVVAGASTDDREEALAGIANAFLIGAPLALALASGLGYLLAKRSLAPVESMRERAARITLERSGERLPLPAARDELGRLGATLNAMLDRIEEALERERVFVADASHELRTPLAVLRAELELAERPGRTPDELRAALASARDEVDRLTQLAADLLVIARSDRGRLALRRERVDIGALLARVRERFEGRARESGREIVVEAGAGLEAELDPLRIEQALGNLIDNALRHGLGEVRVSARREDGVLVLDVLDRGRGFPPGFESRAFERFSRADGGRAGGGAGLGLAIVEAIARAHGGRASIDGRTVVRIALPAEAAES